MSLILISCEPESYVGSPLIGEVALSESYEEVADAACEMWCNFLPPHDRAKGRHLARQIKQANGNVVWVRIHKSRFADIVRSAPPDGLELQLQIDKSPVSASDYTHAVFNSPSLLEIGLPALSSGSGSINSREHHPEGEDNTENNKGCPSPISPLTPGRFLTEFPPYEAPSSLKSPSILPSDPIGAKTPFKSGQEAFLAGRYNDARAQFQLAADQYHGTRDTRQEADCLVRLGMTCRHLKDHAIARSHLLAARALYEGLGDDCRQEKFQCERHLARIEEDVGNLEAASNAYQRLKFAAEQAGLRTQQAWCCYYLGHVYNHHRMKRYEEALSNLKDAVNISRGIGNVEIEAFATEECGYAAERQAQSELAMGCYQEALRLFKTGGGGQWVDNETRVKQRISQLKGKPPKPSGSRKFTLGWLSRK